MSGPRLQGRGIIIVGGGRGIGAAITRGLGAEGARVVAMGRGMENLHQVVGDVDAAGGAGKAAFLDVQDADRIPAAFDEAVGWLGRLDAMVYSAGVTSTIGVLDLDLEEWRRVLSVNLDGAFVAAREAARRMRDRSGDRSIVLVGSQLAHAAIPGKAHYIASKGGMEALVRVLAIELAPLGIRANVLAPGVTRTDMAMTRLDVDDEARAWTEGRIPLGRLAEPEEMTEGAIYLVSEASSYVTGTTLVIDGGYLAR